MTLGVSFLDPFEDSQSNGIRPKKEVDIDDQIMEELEQMGFEKQSTIQSVLSEKFNQAAGTYYLLAFQKGKDSAAFSRDIQQRAKDREKKATDIPEQDSNKKTSRAEKDKTSEELARVLFQVEREKNGQAAATTQAPIPTGKKTEVKHPNLIKKKNHPEVQESTSHTKSSIAPKHNSKDQKSPLPAPKQASNAKTIGLNQLSSVDGIKKMQAEAEKLTISGISLKETKTKHIPIDENLYAPDDDKQIKGLMGIPRTIKMAFNCTANSSASADELFEKLRTVFHSNDVEWFHDKYLCECKWGDVKLEVEICKIPSLPLHGIRLKKLVGDVWEFKKISSKLCSGLGLSE